MSDRDSNLTHDPGPPLPEAAAKPAVVGGWSPARRRFLTRGLVGGPVTLLVATRSVESLAGTSFCHRSAWSSATADGTQPAGTTSVETASCELGKSVTTWRNAGQGAWPSPYNSGTPRFDGVFSPSSNHDKFTDILAGTGSNTQREADFIAALLNAASIGGYPFNTSTNTVLSYWSAYVASPFVPSYYLYLEYLNTL